jgi:hypothetical protein
MTIANKIRRMLAEGKTAKEIAQKLKIKNAYVHTIKWQDKKASDFVSKVFEKAGKAKKSTKIVAAVKEMKTALDFLEKERADEARTTALNKKPTKLFVQPKHLKPAHTCSTW